MVLTTYADDHSVLEALRAGARGYLTKDAGSPRSATPCSRFSTTRRPSTRRCSTIWSTPSPPAPGPGPTLPPLSPGGLTPREAEVLSCIASGLSNTEIADRLVVSEGTVKSHINHIFAKIGARDRAQAVAYAYQNGLVS